MADYEIKNLYQGGYSTFDSSKSLSPARYPVSAGSFGLTTDPRSANILKEVSSKLSSGVKQIEVEGVSPEVFESMPNQDLEEANRLAKLTGVSLSLHGPVVDSAGIDRNGFSELNREASERRFIQTVERGHMLNPDGNIIINFHSAEGITGSEYENTPEGRRAKRLIVVNRENGKSASLEPEVKYYPDEMRGLKPGVTREDIERVKRKELGEEQITRVIPLKEGEKISAEERIGIMNRSEWDNSLRQLIFNKERADEILDRNAPQIQHFLKDYDGGKFNDETLKNFPEARAALAHYKNAEAYLHDTHQQLNALFSKAYEFGDDKQKKALADLSEQFNPQLSPLPST